MEDLGPAQYFLGVRITRNRQNKKIYLCQDAYIKKVLARFQMENCKPVSTPMASGAMEFMVPNQEQATKKDISQYQQLIGSLMYISVYTRPDLSFTLLVLSRFLINPSQQHIKAARRVLQYL